MPTVFVPPSNRRGRDEKYYHTDPNCGYLKRAGGIEKPLSVLGGNWECCSRCAARSTAGRHAIRDVVEANDAVELVVSATGSKGHLRVDGDVLCHAGNSQRSFTDVDGLSDGNVCGNCARDAFQAGIVDTPDVPETPLVTDGGYRHDTDRIDGTLLVECPRDESHLSVTVEVTNWDRRPSELFWLDDCTVCGAELSHIEQTEPTEVVG